MYTCHDQTHALTVDMIPNSNTDDKTEATPPEPSADSTTPSDAVPAAADASDDKTESTGKIVYRSTTDPTKLQRCRFYEQKYPKNEDLVMVRVRTVESLAAYVNLIEYEDADGPVGGREGMVLLSELSRRRIRSIAKLIRVGRDEIVQVLRVDEEKGYVDLSKRKVVRDDVPDFEDKFSKAKTVHSILRHVADTCKVVLEDLYTHIAWPLYRSHGHAHEAFKASITDPEGVFGGIYMTKEIRESLYKDIRRRMAAQPIKFRADIEVSCFTIEGIDAIKAALFAGMKSNPKQDIQIRLLAPPKYVLFTTMYDRQKGVAVLQEAINVITKEITERKGSCVVKDPPRATTQEEDSRLKEKYSELARQNQEKAGD